MSLLRIEHVCQFMESFAPRRLAEEWDNVGLLIGDRKTEVRKIMTCLTVTPETVDEAIGEQADLIVSHHPMPFRPMKKLTTDNVATGIVWKLAGAGIAVYSPHTSFDSAAQGINQSLIEKIGVTSAKPLVPDDSNALVSVGKEPLDQPPLGAGRCGRLAQSKTLQELAVQIANDFELPGVQAVGAPDRELTKVAVACGSGGSFLDHAKRTGCDVLVTGEATFHTSLEAKASGVALILMSHYASERFAVEDLAVRISDEFADVTVWPSRNETDPVQWIARP